MVFLLLTRQRSHYIVSGSEDNTTRKRNCDTGFTVGEPWNGSSPGSIYISEMLPDGKKIACGRWNESVQRWN
ncbi:hypothetical protein BDR04DRAFT_999293 [Suillus decipiens]|nr:hypothetical protein BDR04DRAFT_999293 [Suillus decipiens]